MLTIEADGRLVFCIDLPGAQSVEVVGNFHGWHEQRYPMIQGPDGKWHLELRVGCGEYLFRYIIDQCFPVLDGSAHGSRISASGVEMSRIWMPPPTIEPDSIAA